MLTHPAVDGSHQLVAYYRVPTQQQGGLRRHRAGLRRGKGIIDGRIEQSER